MVLESESFSVSDRTRYRVSYILRLEKQLRVHHVEFFSGTKISHSHRISTFRPTHSQDRDTVRPNITFRGFSTYIRDPRVQEILVITKPSVMSRIFFLLKASASLNTGLPSLKYESHTPSQEIVKSGALQGILHSRSKFFEPENAAKMRYRVVFAYYVSRTESHKRHTQQMCWKGG